MKTYQVLGKVKKNTCNDIVSDILSQKYKEINIIISNTSNNLNNLVSCLTQSIETDINHLYGKIFHIESDDNNFTDVKYWLNDNKNNNEIALILIDPNISINLKDVKTFLDKDKLMLINIKY